MLFNVFRHMADNITADLSERQEEERSLVNESELNDVDFMIYFDKTILPVFALVAVFLVLIMLKAFWRECYTLIILHKLPEMGAAARVLFLSGLCLLFVCLIVLPVLLILQPKPHIVKNHLIHRKKTYHYSEITSIRISTMQFISVYAGKRKLFTMTAEYVNSYSFLEWAKKCQIPVHEKPGIDEIQIKNTTVVIIVIVVILLAIAVAVMPLLIFL